MKKGTARISMAILRSGLEKVFGEKLSEFSQMLQHRVDVLKSEMSGLKESEHVLVDLKDRFRLSQEIFHHPRMANVVSELPVGRFDFELTGEFGGFEIDIVEAQDGGEFVEDIFWGDHEIGEGSGEAEKGDAPVVVGGVPVFS